MATMSLIAIATLELFLLYFSITLSKKQKTKFEKKTIIFSVFRNIVL